MSICFCFPLKRQSLLTISGISSDIPDTSLQIRLFFFWIYQVLYHLLGHILYRIFLWRTCLLCIVCESCKTGKDPEYFPDLPWTRLFVTPDLTEQFRNNCPLRECKGYFFLLFCKAFCCRKLQWYFLL